MMRKIALVVFCFAASLLYAQDRHLFQNIAEQHISIEQLEKRLPQLLSVPNDCSFRIIRDETDDLGIQHLTFQQYINGIEVEGGTLIAHARNGLIETINGFVIQQETNNSKHIVHRYRLASNKTSNNAQNQKIIALDKDTATIYVLADIIFSSAKMSNIYLDHITKDTLKIVPCIQHADATGQALTLYNGWQQITNYYDFANRYYFLIDSTRNIATLNATNATPIDYETLMNPENFPDSVKAYIATFDGEPNAQQQQTLKNMLISPAIASYILSCSPYFNATTLWQNANQQAAYSAHWGMEKAYDYYLTTFNRKSFDNKQHVIYNLINPQPDALLFNNKDLPLNAFAYSGCEPYFMAYGMGDGQRMKPVVALDVLAHEYSHLVIKCNGNGGLENIGESGALNESFADIMAISTKNYVNGYCNWTIGEDFMIQVPNMRSFNSPNSSGVVPQPDTYNGTYWANTADISDATDHGGVHTNSGVQNYWYYLLCNGGSGTNDKGQKYSVKGIGISKGQQIAYRNLIYYLTYTASFADSRNGSIQAAIDLYGKGSQEHQSVVNAWYAVGVGEPYTEEPNLCVSPQYPNVVFLQKPTDMTTNVYCYVWTENGITTEVAGKWPGTVASDLGEGYYQYEIPSNAGTITNNWQIIWSDGLHQSSDLPLINNALYSGTSVATIKQTAKITTICQDSTPIVCLHDAAQQVVFLSKPTDMTDYIYCYVWHTDNGTTTEVAGAWPGTLAVNLGDGYFKYEIPNNAGKIASNWQIIWYDGTTKQSADLPLVNRSLYSGTTATTIKQQEIVNLLCDGGTLTIDGLSQPADISIPYKIIENGNIYILYNGKKYTILGERIK